MLLFRFLATAADSDKDTAEFAKSVLKKTILSKYPDFFCQHFSEAIVVYNGWTDHPAYQAAQASGSEGGSSVVTLDGVELQGAQSKKARFLLYSFMAEGFTEEQKIHVTAKIVDDILGYSIDSNSISAHPAQQKSSRKGDADGVTFVPYEETLEDAFLILRSPLLKIGRKGGLDSLDDDLQDGDELVTSGKAAVAKAKSIVLKKLSRQHLVGHVLPVVMSLKHMLESSRSPLQGPIMELLVALVKSNKAEVDQALANDPTLKAEIEYDLRQFAKSKERQKGADAHNTVQGSTSTRRVTIVSDKEYDGAASEKRSSGKILQPSLRKGRSSSSGADGYPLL